jgi:hypothetical protein
MLPTFTILLYSTLIVIVKIYVSYNTDYRTIIPFAHWEDCCTYT